jgi:hypothetical protein
MADNGIPPTNTKKEPMIRLGIYVKRHPSLTSEEFHEYVAQTGRHGHPCRNGQRLTSSRRRWSKVHGALVKGWLAEKGIYRYTQVSHSRSVHVKMLDRSN